MAFCLDFTFIFLLDGLFVLEWTLYCVTNTVVMWIIIISRILWQEEIQNWSMSRLEQQLPSHVVRRRTEADFLLLTTAGTFSKVVVVVEMSRLHQRVCGYCRCVLQESKNHNLAHDIVNCCGWD